MNGGSCYCETCRNLSGGAYSIVARVSSNEFNIVEGNEFLHPYESSPCKMRYHCSNCSSPIFVTVKSKPEFVRV
jgi:hypothetical protein